VKKAAVKQQNPAAKGLGVALAQMLLLGACFYTDTINEAPVPGIREKQSGPYWVGSRVAFDATKTTDDGVGSSELTPHWKAFLCRGPQGAECTDTEELEGEGGGTLNEDFFFDISQRGRHLVQLQVEDGRKAIRLQPDVFEFDVVNRQPSAWIEVHGYEDGPDRYVIGRPIELFARVADEDGDELDVQWDLVAADGAAATLEGFGENAKLLSPDAVGRWTVRIQVDDGGGQPETSSVELDVVEDRPPCIVVTSPARADGHYYVLDKGDDPRRFSVLVVQDALDPFPPLADDDPVTGQAGFVWFMKAPGQSSYEPIAGWNESSFAVSPQAYRSGETLELRVEVRDRIEGPSRDLPCPESEWSCKLDTTGDCYQRQTWGVRIQ
jgi:hypothetical protein